MRVLLLIVGLTGIGFCQSVVNSGTAVDQEIATLQSSEDFVRTRLTKLENSAIHSSIPAGAIAAQKGVLENRILAIRLQKLSLQLTSLLQCAVDCADMPLRFARLRADLAAAQQERSRREIEQQRGRSDTFRNLLQELESSLRTPKNQGK